MDKANVIKELSCLHAVSGYEFRIAEEIADMFSHYCDSVSTDALGSVIGVKRSGNPDAKSVMLEAHMDEIGMMITEVDEKGFLRFTNIGGIDARILPGKEVVIHGKEDIIGIIGAKPPHATTEEERKKALPMSELYIDALLCADRIKELLQVGDTVTFADSFQMLGKNLISAKSQDDRTSIAVLLSVMEKLKDISLPFDVYYCACVQEEVGRRGAMALATSVNPVFAVAVDVCHAKTPDASSSVFASGSGTVISKGPNIHPLLLNHALDVMNKKGINYSIDIDGGDTGTDAWAIQIAKEGIPTILFSLPLKYMHTMVETVHMDDVSATADAIASLIENTKDAEAVVCWK